MGLIRTFRRDLGAQFNWSRNLEESLGKKLRRAFWAMVFVLNGLLIACRWTKTECLGSTVIYDGRTCFVSNLAQSPYPTLADGNGFYEQNVPREKITSVVNARELWHRFDSGFSFYMGYWHAIDVSRKVYPETAESCGTGEERVA